jgi:uncharacterized protein (TIGR03067 family)
MRTLFALVFAPAVLLAAPVPKDKDKKDEDAIVGSWAVAAAACERLPGKREDLRFVFAEKGKFTLRASDSNSHDGEFKLDTTTSPKTLDLTIDGKPSPAVYDLDGDTITVCLPLDKDQMRPKAFAPDAKSNTAVLILVRLDPKTGKPVPQPKNEDAAALAGTWACSGYDDGGGKPLPLDSLADKRFVFAEKGKFSGLSPDENKNGTYELGTLGKRKTVTINDGRQTMPMLYELDGDTLKLSTSYYGLPVAVAACQDTKTLLLTLKRVKDEKKDK